YASTMPGILEIASTNCFVCMNSDKLSFKAFNLCVIRGVGGGGRVIADKRGGSTIVVTRTSTIDVASVLTLKIESIPKSGLGLSMFETKPNDIEELCC
ncbi:hypothetical protein Tco_0287835, partial [Tanacetum coccineum]